MDDSDRKLLVLLCANPRMHYRELARRLGISRQAVHHRVRLLTEAGVISKAIAGISVSYLDAVPVAVFGSSKTASIERTLDRLGESEFTRRVLVAGGNYLYVVGFLRDISELDGYVEFVGRSAEMPEPNVGVYTLDEGLMPHYSVDGIGKRKQIHKELSPLDLRIIASLRDDARKPVSEIASVVGATPKTVRRHLDDMIADGSLDISMPGDLQVAGDMLLTMHVALKDGSNKREVGRRLLSKRHFPDQYIISYCNIPGLLIWVFWSDNIAEVRRARRETCEDEDVRSVMLNFLYLERIYHTWRDMLLETGFSSSKKTGVANPQSAHRKR